MTKDNEKKIYIVLMHTKTIPSKIVKFFTKYKYSHVAISLEKGCKTTYSFGRRKLNSILNGGFSVLQKDGEFFKKFNKTECKIYEIEVTEEQYRKVSEIIEKMIKEQEKYKYDFIGIIPRFFGIPITIKNRYVCSYFVAEVLEKANILKFNKPTCLIKPKDFENIKIFKKIYEGKYV